MKISEETEYTSSVQEHQLCIDGCLTNTKFRWHMSEKRNGGDTHFVFIGMNPSDAISLSNTDPTVKKILDVVEIQQRFQRFGTPGRVSIVNLTPVHGSNPDKIKRLLRAIEPPEMVHAISQANELVILETLQLSSPEDTIIVPMWGAGSWPLALKTRMKNFLKRTDIRQRYRDIAAFLTSKNQPAHPNPQFWYKSYWNINAHPKDPVSLLGNNTWPQ